MAKGFKKLLMLSAAIGAVAGAFYYYNQKKITEELDEFDDFDESDEAKEVSDTDKNRSYVSLNPAKVTKAAGDTVTEAAQKVSDLASDAASTTAETIEEFFDEDDIS